MPLSADTPDSRTTPLRIGVIGAGAAGMFAAINLAEQLSAQGQPYQMTVLESGARPLQKVRISGGGRCNVTHACFDPKLLVQHYPRGAKALPSVFSRFQPEDMVRWLSQRGLLLHTESDGRMFPVQNDSQAVIDLFLALAKKHRIDVRCNQKILQLEKQQVGFEIRTTHDQMHVDRLILATGYSSSGWHLATSLGHTVIPPVPSLFPFKILSPVLADLQGISLPLVKGRLAFAQKTDKTEAQGAVLITHSGLSGPVIYRLSALGANALFHNNYHAQLILDLLPDQKNEAVLRAQLSELLQQTHKGKKLKNTQCAYFPQRLWLSLLTYSGADLEAQADVTSKKVLNQLLENIKRLTLPVTGKNPSKEEFVSCGGVDLKEIDFKTMASKICPGLYLVGEILNIDGLTGGFNFQACWSAAWVLSESSASG